jgi:carboxylesterase
MIRHQASRTGWLDDMVDRRETDIAFYTGSTVLVYLIHGVTGTPAEMSYLARKLARKNRWDVYVTTLPGHCTRLRDLVKTTERDWRAHVQRQLLFIRDRYEHLFVGGLSAGALLALDASVTVRVEGIGVFSPTFVYDGWNTPWSHAILPLAMTLVPLSLQRWLFHLDGPPFGIKDELLQTSVRKSYRLTTILAEWVNEWQARWKAIDGQKLPPPSAASKGYPIFPLRTLTEINRLILSVRSRLHEVTAPTIILQAREDDMTSPRNASIVYDMISSTNKQLILLDDCYHVITIDKQRQAVVKNLTAFFLFGIEARHSYQQSEVGS